MLVADPAYLKQILAVFRDDSKYAGGGIGVPFKDKVIGYLDGFIDQARKIGAVNIIAKKGRELYGRNTDGQGFVRSLQAMFSARGEDISGRKAVILGSGGTCNAVAFALVSAGMNIVILNRTVEKAKALSEKIVFCFKIGYNRRVRYGGEVEIIHEVRDADAVINVSTKGSAGELEQYSALASVIMPATDQNIARNLRRAQMVLEAIPQRAIICDIVLRNGLSPMLSSAQNAGYQIMDGVPMVINQGVEAFCWVHQDEIASKGISFNDIARVMRQATGF